MADQAGNTRRRDFDSSSTLIDRHGTRYLCRPAFTLIELLLIIAIIGLLVQLLLPAVQSAREAARRSLCMNHLRQLGLAALHHEEAQGHLPTGGWGFSWVGDLNRAFGSDQPGGWAYNVLPYLEQQPLHDLARDPKGQSREAINAQLCRTPVPLFYCPTRRAARCYAYPDFQRFPTRHCDPVVDSAKTDYAANAGDFFVDGPAGPTDEVEAASFRYAWIDGNLMTGVVFQRSRVKMHQITDGTSQTYLFGEKYLDSAHYEDGLGGGDDQTAWCGYDQDVVRWTYGAGVRPPLQDRREYKDWITFGSAHHAGCSFVFCDGSVRLISYAIDGGVHRWLGSRHDGHAAQPDATE